MKKVGIINFHYSNNNYGAVLQASSISSVISDLGYSVEHIDYIPQKNTDNEPLKLKLRRLAIRFLELIKIKKLLIALRGDKVYIKDEVSGNHIFEDFRSKWVPRSERTFYKASDLKAIGDDYDSLFVGSDQVWRPRMYVNPFSDTYAYFLQFAGKNTKRISYAASFGVDAWEKSLHPSITSDVNNAINQFNAISVREASGVQICKEQFKVQAEHVLDPTLLVGKNFFESIIADEEVRVSAGKVVYYKLDSNEQFISRLNEIAKKLDTSIKNIYYKKTASGYEYNTVAAWLANIRDCKLIVTDSFHCVCFSILFEKDFVCIGNKERGLARLYSLLSILGLEDRLIDDELDYSETYNTLPAIDYEKVKVKLELLKENSKDFIVKALS